MLQSSSEWGGWAVPLLCTQDPTGPALGLADPLSLCSVYSGHQSILIPPSELETNPALWLLAVSQYKVRDTFCSYSVMELCTKGLGSQTESLKVSGPPPPPARAWGHLQCPGPWEGVSRS